MLPFSPVPTDYRRNSSLLSCPPNSDLCSSNGLTFMFSLFHRMWTASNTCICSCSKFSSEILGEASFLLLMKMISQSSDHRPFSRWRFSHCSLKWHYHFFFKLFSSVTLLTPFFWMYDLDLGWSNGLDLFGLWFCMDIAHIQGIFLWKECSKHFTFWMLNREWNGGRLYQFWQLRTSPCGWWNQWSFSWILVGMIHFYWWAVGCHPGRWEKTCRFRYRSWMRREVRVFVGLLWEGSFQVRISLFYSLHDKIIAFTQTIKLKIIYAMKQKLKKGQKILFSIYFYYHA